jgi:hypothetical protein
VSLKYYSLKIDFLNLNFPLLCFFKRLENLFFLPFAIGNVQKKEEKGKNIL